MASYDKLPQELFNVTVGDVFIISELPKRYQNFAKAVLELDDEGVVKSINSNILYLDYDDKVTMKDGTTHYVYRIDHELCRVYVSPETMWYPMNEVTGVKW